MLRAWQQGILDLRRLFAEPSASADEELGCVASFAAGTELPACLEKVCKPALTP